MRTSTGLVFVSLSISIMLNIVLLVLLAGKPEQKSALSAHIKSETLVVDKSAKNETTSNNTEVSIDAEKSNVENKAEFGAIIAMINNAKVRQLELLPYLNEIMPADQAAQMTSFDAIPEVFLESAINSYATDLLLEKLAIEKHVTNNPRLQAIINKNKRRNIRTAYLNSISPTLVSKEQIKIKYDALVASLTGKKEYHARHILLASKKEANIISKALLKKERSFDELAKLFSLDDSTGFNGGDLGYQVVGQLEPTFEQAISALALNAYSKPFKTALGWHIAIVENRRDAEIMPYEQATVIIRKNLQQQAIKTLVNRLLADADIVRINHPQQ